MNERIELLAEQADNYAKQTVHYYQGQFDGLTWEGKIKEVRDTKFAELIVKECGVALNPMLRNMVSRGQAYDLIKQHFGKEKNT
jgi:hypothetical protein